MVQLTPEEGEAYSKVPVVLDFASGFYVFPVCVVFQVRQRKFDTPSFSLMKTIWSKWLSTKVGE
jgi:hypothetical protein